MSAPDKQQSGTGKVTVVALLPTIWWVAWASSHLSHEAWWALPLLATVQAAIYLASLFIVLWMDGNLEGGEQ